MNRYWKRRKDRFCRSRTPLRRLAFEQLDGRLVLSAGALGQAAMVDAEPVSDAGFVAPAETADGAASGQSGPSQEISPADPSDLLVFFLISTQSNLGQSMAALPEDGPMPQATNGLSLVADYDTEIVALQLSSTGTVETEIVALQLSCTGDFEAEIVALDPNCSDTFDTEMVSMQLSDIAPPRGVIIAASEGSDATSHFDTELVALDLRAVDSFFDVFVEIELPGAAGGSGPGDFSETELEEFILDLELGLE